MRKQLIVVHDDGETWTMASGAKLCEVTASQFKKLEAGEYPRTMRLRGLPLGKLLVTRKAIVDAPMFAVFRGPGEKPKMTYHDQWDLVSEADPHIDVLKKANELGIRLIRDIRGDILRVEKDDEFCEGLDVDAIDAAMAYLNNGGLIVKMPNTLRSKNYGLYAVASYKPPVKGEAR